VIAAASAFLFGALAPAAPIAAGASALEPWTGEAKPQFDLVAADGTRHDLGTLSGRVVIVHFFATWCEPCKAELAALDRLSAGPQAHSISILAISVAEPADRVRRFLTTHPVTFPVLLDVDRTVTRAWEVSALPTSFVLDGELQPQRFLEGEVDWSSAEVTHQLDQLRDPQDQTRAGAYQAPRQSE
jgi:peroxiredoxin